MATTPATPETPGSTNTAGLAPWAAPYITGYLGQAQALGQMPYQTYQGPLTAGTSPLQSQAFQGIGGLTVPNQGQYTPVGGSFTGVGAPQVPTAQQFQNAGSLAGVTGGPAEMYGPGFGQKLPTDGSLVGRGGATPGGYLGGEPIGGGFFPGEPGGDFIDTRPPSERGPMPGQQPQNVAAQYMNPYLQNVLDPQLREMQRQSTINMMPQLAKLTGAGGYGGSREAIMRSEAGRNLLDAQTGAIGKGYADAFDAARQQFNTEQQRKIQEAQFGAEFGLKGLGAQQNIYDQMMKAGQAQRGIEQEGITADLEEFNRQREFPYKQVQFMRDMISGLPIGSVTNAPAQLSGVAALISAMGGVDALLKQTGQKDLSSLLNNLFGFGGGAAPTTE